MPINSELHDGWLVRRSYTRLRIRRAPASSAVPASPGRQAIRTVGSRDLNPDRRAFQNPSFDRAPHARRVVETTPVSKTDAANNDQIVGHAPHDGFRPRRPDRALASASIRTIFLPKHTFRHAEHDLPASQIFEVKRVPIARFQTASVWTTGASSGFRSYGPLTRRLTRDDLMGQRVANCSSTAGERAAGFPTPKQARVKLQSASVCEMYRHRRTE